MPLRLHLVPGWKRFLVVAAPITLAIAVLAGAYAYSSSANAANPSPGPAGANGLDVPPQPGLLVHVVGAVENPGLFRLPRGDRVFDAIAAAGGFSPYADMSRLPNLAGRLRDGEQVKVPFAKTSSGTVIARVNLNQATLEELEAVPGFTPGFAQECIDYRVNFGGFQNTRELVDILGMGEAEYVIARRYLTL
ncbi:MAG TPA: helix-hairpin-helix domain-containing protein [Candidatus Dormibacteraeota bacterium]|nr:helix-hairpin-helix domain-containing protein [Candidatus Dormibacteraeota bacterium]